MRIATYNVNSVRSRVARIVDWMVREDIDILAMQEIKCTEAQFPFDEFQAAGYEVVLHGLNQWNGVAIASRQPIQDVEVGFDGMPGYRKGSRGSRSAARGTSDRRNRRWHPDLEPVRAQRARARRPALHYKLDWLAALAAATGDWMADHPDQPIALIGDFNVAPLDSDNGDPTVIPGSDDARVRAGACGVP